MRTGSACIAGIAGLATLLALPSAASAEAPQWGIDGTTVVRGGAALRDHVIVVVSAWCTYIDEPAVWAEADDFYGEPDEPPTVGNNFYGCTYNLVEDGEKLGGGPWDAPRARDDIVYALPRAKFPVQDDTIAALDGIPLREFYPRLESGKDGVLRAKLGPTRGIRVPDDSPLVGFEDTLRAELRDGAFTLLAEQRLWKLHDGREIVEPLADAPPSEPSPVPVPEALANPIPVPEVLTKPTPTPVPDVHTNPTPIPVPDVHTNPTPIPAPDVLTNPIPVPEVVPEPPAGVSTPATVTGPPLARDLAIGGGCLALGLLAGFGVRRRR